MNFRKHRRKSDVGMSHARMTINYRKNPCSIHRYIHRYMVYIGIKTPFTVNTAWSCSRVKEEW